MNLEEMNVRKNQLEQAIQRSTQSVYQLQGNLDELNYHIGQAMKPEIAQPPLVNPDDSEVQ